MAAFVKSGVVELTNDDRTIILGALIWMAGKLESEDGERARAIRTKLGKQAFAAEQATGHLVQQDQTR